MSERVTLRWKSLGFGVMLGVGLLLAITPDRIAAVPTDAADLPEPALAGDELSAIELAAALAAGEPLTVIDLRDRWEYEEFHLPGALRLSQSELLSAESLGRLDPAHRLVVVGADRTAPGQAAGLLRNAGFDAIALRGGVGAWWREVLAPASIDSTIPPQQLAAVAARRAAWRARFLGGGELAADAELPVLLPPPPPPAPAGAGRKPASGRGKGC